MGFVTTDDAFCLHGALQGLGNCLEMVDDMLLCEEDYLSQISKVLSKCWHHHQCH